MKKWSERGKTEGEEEEGEEHGGVLLHSVKTLFWKAEERQIFRPHIKSYISFKLLQLSQNTLSPVKYT